MSSRRQRPQPRQNPASAAPPAASVTERTVRRVAAIVIGAVVIGLVIFTAIIANTPQAAPPASSAAPVAGSGDLLVRADSRKLNDPPNPKATFVEFLDFECEACGAVFPSIEKIRQTYADKVTFVIRYFPIQSHFNAMRSARAVEAAAQQGKLEAMYAKMYQTQTDWAEKQIPQDDLFRSYAQGLGLDMAAWDAAYNDPATTARIQRDLDDGTKLGVPGTPTFFLDGKLIEPKSVADLTTLIDQAVAGK